MVAIHKKLTGNRNRTRPYQRVCGGVLLTLLALVLVPVVVVGQYGTQIGCLDSSCTGRLTELIHKYEYAVASVNGCDTDCLYGCYEMIEDALKEKDGVSCPPIGELARCFGVFGDEWVSLARDCPLFNIKEQQAAAEGESATNGAEAPSSEEAAEGAEAPSSEEAAEAAEASSTSRRRMQQTTGEAEAEAEGTPSPEEAESAEAGEAADRASSEEEAEAADAPSSSEAEASSSDAEAEAEGECSSSTSSGEGGEGEGDIGSGCFPDLETYQDFEKYVQGAYYSSVWAQPSNTVGVILSVFFWLGLGGMGVYLGRK